MSVVICTRDRPESITLAVRSVIKAAERENAEVLVVDQSDEGHRASNTDPGCGLVRWIPTDTRGKGAALNIGTRAARGEIIAYTDDDCSVPEEWLTLIREAFEGEPRAGIMYGSVGAGRSADGAANAPGIAVRERRLVGGEFPFELFGMGANWAMRRSVFDRVGSFDEALCVGGALRSGEDYDYQIRAHVAGVSTLLEPRMVVEHFGVRTSSEWAQLMARYGFGDGALLAKQARQHERWAASLLGKKFFAYIPRAVWHAAWRNTHGIRYIGSYGRGFVAGLRHPMVPNEHVYDGHGRRRRGA